MIGNCYDKNSTHDTCNLTKFVYEQHTVK